MTGVKGEESAAASPVEPARQPLAYEPSNTIADQALCTAIASVHPYVLAKTLHQKNASFKRPGC